MAKKKIDKLYDKTFKRWISEKSEAIALSKNFLPSNISDNLDYETMTIENTSYIDASFEEHASDFVYSCRWKTAEEVKISFIYEHKSYLPRFPEFQLLRYLYNGYNYQIKQGLQPTPIICILFYHGKEQWTKRKISDYFSLQAEQIKQYIPNFDYVLIDLDDYSDDDIMAIETGFLLRSIMLLFKHKDDNQFVLQNIKKIFIFVEEDIPKDQKETYFEMVFTYLMEGFTLKIEEVKQVIQKIPNNLKDKAMSTYDMLIQEGVVIGEERGLEKGLEKGLERGRLFTEKIEAVKSVLNLSLVVPKWSNEKLAGFLHLTPDFIKKVKAGFIDGNEQKARKMMAQLLKEFGELSSQEKQQLEVAFKEKLVKFKKE